MRKAEYSEVEFGEIAIGEIDIDAKSRDDIPAVLRGIQYIYTNAQMRRQVFTLLSEQVRPGINMKVDRPGMDLWRVLVLAALKQGLGCEYGFVQELANQHKTVRQMLGHRTPFKQDKTSYYEWHTLVNNASQITPQILSQIGKLVVESGHQVARKKAWRAIARAH